MRDFHRQRAVMICCSALKPEVESLCKAHWPHHKLVFLPSMMHMHPERLAASLESALETEMRWSQGVVLIFGDCCTRMTVLEALPVVVRTKGRNCLELLLGHGDYFRLFHEGAFLVFPEWVERWKEVLPKEFGLNRQNAVSMMREMHKKLVCLDTGLISIPGEELRKCAEYLGLPYEVLPVSLDPLRNAVEDAVLRCITKVFLRETRLKSQ